MGEDVCREDASDISCCYSHTDKTQVPFYNYFILWIGVPRGMLIRVAHLKFSKDKL